MIKLGRVKLILKDYSFAEDDHAVPDEFKEFSRTDSRDSNIPDC